MRYFVSTESEVLEGWGGGGACPNCVPEVCSEVLPSGVKSLVSIESEVLEE